MSCICDAPCLLGILQASEAQERAAWLQRQVEELQEQLVARDSALPYQPVVGSPPCRMPSLSSLAYCCIAACAVLSCKIVRGVDAALRAVS